uniref:Activator 1 large subunit n=1 Tax=Cacopsylla melanoneura TaxID=428564 RepID=A0A8D8WJC6_9HEMI
MSKDIRSYFSSQKKVSGSSPTISNGKNKEHEKKKKRTFIVSDSDEDSDVVQSPLKKSKQNEKQPPKKNSKEEEKSKYFSANASDVFGSAPVKQLNRNFPVPKKVVASPTVDSGIESQDSNTLEMHDNDEFEAVLSQLDEQDWVSPAKPPKTPKTESPRKETSPKSASKSTSEQSKLLKKSPIASNKKSADSPKQKSSPIKPDSKSSPSKSPKSPSPHVKSPVSSKSKILDSKSPVSSRSEKSLESKLKSPDKSVLSPRKNSLKRSSSVREVSKVPELEDSKVEKVKPKEKSSKSFYGNKESSQSTSNSESSPKPFTQVVPPSSGFTLWVDKYKPKTIKQIVGQQGDKSAVNKLIKWLKNWHINQSGTKKLVKPSPWAKDDDGAYFKAALLSGPPGIGKTTTVSLVCQELGFDLVEFNASDTRSKRLLQEEVSQLLSCASLTPFFSGEEKKGVTHKHVLVMDEVDGMAGNEDRGGVQELIQLIKAAKVPVICMCNDRSHPKIRSLVNYCFDLPVHRPRVEQIKAAMMSICFKENIKVSPQVMTDIITNSNQDIRATLNQLSMLSAQSQSNTVQSEAKNVKLGPWDVLRKVFSHEEQKTMTVFDKSDLFFHDYQVAPLFVHENYLSVTPYNFDKNKKSAKMVLFAKAAESLSKGDLIEKQIRQNSSWSLLPTQAMFSSVIPGHYLAGHVSGRIQFPMWFGKNSRGNKIDRLVQEIQVHTRLRTSSSKESINLDYMRYLRDAILEPLIKSGSDGVQESLAKLQHYCLTREDMDSICEVSAWPNATDPMTKIESKVKAAFTRAYNKTAIVTPYALVAPVKKGNGGKTEGEEGMEEEEEEEDNEQEDDNMDADAMIVAKKKPTAGSSKAPSSAAASSSRGGGGKGGKGSRGGKK